MPAEENSEEQAVHPDGEQAVHASLPSQRLDNPEASSSNQIAPAEGHSAEVVQKADEDSEDESDASHTAARASPPRSTQPQPFPLSPPTPKIELLPEPVTAEDDLSDDSDEFPALDELVDQMHPGRSSQSHTVKDESSPPPNRAAVKEEAPDDNIIYVSSREPSPMSRYPATQPPPSSKRQKPRFSNATQPAASQSPSIRPKPASARNTSHSDLKRRLSSASVSGNAKASPKRPRKFKKHEDFWALDGSVILQVEDYQFKLHRSSLAKQSAWMSVLFEEAPDGEDVGGMPIYCLDKTGLRASDFEVLLRTWENAIQFAKEPAPFATIVSVLRASMALHFLDYEAFARDQLEKLWPAGLDDVTPTRIPNAIGTIVITRDGQLPAVRKRAMYELVRTEGFGQSEAGEEKLTDTEHRALVRAREKLTFAWVMNSGIMAPKVQKPADGRHLYQECVEKRRLGDSKYCEVIREAKIIEEYMNDAICGFKALIDIDWVSHGFCKQCADDKRALWRELREKEWLNLDEYLSESN